MDPVLALPETGIRVADFQLNLPNKIYEQVFLHSSVYHLCWV